MAMENLGGEMGNLRDETEESIEDSNQKDDTKTKIDNTKSEDLDGLQMLRLPQEDDKSLLRKDILPVVKSEESIDQPTLVEDHVDDGKVKKCFQVSKLVIREEDNSPLEKPQMDIVTEKKEEAELDDVKPNIEQDVSIKRVALKHYSVPEGAQVKPALVKKEVGEIQDRLTERQQKILQDFHVKFVLEGVNEEENDESKARKHSEFVELKKRLEEEEKMYAGCALGEPSEIIDGGDIKYQMEQGETVGDSYDGGKDVNRSTTVIARNVTATLNDANEDTIDSSTGAVRATIDGVINSLAEVSICSPGESSLEEDVKLQLRQTPNVRNAMKDLAYDDEGLSELQEYTNREGSIGCQYCCQKAGKQIEKGDKNDVYMMHSPYSALNVVCPISGIPVVDLEDPIRSEECEHIYDRLSALNFISSMAKDGFCLCASPGCRAILAKNKLVTDCRLWQDIEELRQIKATMWESRLLQDLVNIDDSDDD